MRKGCGAWAASGTVATTTHVAHQRLLAGEGCGLLSGLRRLRRLGRSLKVGQRCRLLLLLLLLPVGPRLLLLLLAPLLLLQVLLLGQAHGGALQQLLLRLQEMLLGLLLLLLREGGARRQGAVGHTELRGSKAIKWGGGGQEGGCVAARSSMRQRAVARQESGGCVL